MLRGDSFVDVPEEEIRAFLTQSGFIDFRQLEDGTVIGLLPLMYTLSVCCDVTPTTAYHYRWCFEDREEAVYFFQSVKKFNEVPTRRKSLKGHRFPRRSGPLLEENDENGFPKW